MIDEIVNDMAKKRTRTRAILTKKMRGKLFHVTKYAVNSMKYYFFFISMSNVDLTVPESVYITGQR